MPITKAPGYKDSNGTVHPSLEEAQQSELASILERSMPPSEAAGTRDLNYMQLADAVLTSSDAIVQVLTTGPRSRPRARKAVATTNPRRAARRATLEQAKAGFTVVRAAVNGDAEPILVEQPITH